MNSIADKLMRSWRLFRTSVTVLRSHPKLLVFPLLTGLLTLFIASFFIVPVLLLLVVPQWVHGGPLHAIADRVGFIRIHGGGGLSYQMHPLGMCLLAGMYLLDMFLAAMSSVAFNSEIMEALSGRPVSIRHGLEAAFQRWKPVLLWSLMAGTVGLLIRAVEERFSFIGKIIAGIVGLAWSVAAIFAIPVLVREPSLTNPFQVLSRSARTIKETWGEMLAGYLGMQGTNLLFLWCSIVYWLGAGATALALSNAWVLLFALAPWLVCLVAYSYLSSIASRVYLCALYLYASEGTVPGPFDASMMNTAFRLKKA